MIRVLHILNELRPSGAEVMLTAARREWNRAGIQGDILATGGTVGVYARELADAGYAINHLPFRREPSFFAQVFKTMSAGNYDLVHIHTERANVAYGVVARWAGLPVVRTVHAVFPFAGGLQLRRKLERGLLRLLGCRHIAISNTVQNNERETFANPTEMIGNWIDTSRFAPPTVGERYAARQDMGLAKDAFAIAMVGNCEAAKNHRAMIEAVAALKDPRIVLLHVGCEDPAHGERNVAEKLGIATQVYFTGARSDVPEILHAADAFVMPSLREGFGNAAAEAMAAGLPVVLTPALGHFRGVAPGIFWSQPDARSLALAILQIMRMPAGARQDLGFKNSLAAARQFAPQQGAGAYARLYQELAGSNRQAPIPQPTAQGVLQ